MAINRPPLSPWPTDDLGALALATGALGQALGEANVGSLQFDTNLRRLGAAASALVERYAPGAPQAIRDEATIRVAGYLKEMPKAPIRSETVGPMTVDYAPSMTNAMRHSGALALLSPWEDPPGGAGLMRWPWQKPAPERRDSGGAFYDRVLLAIEAEAAGSAVDNGSTAALEAVAGALSRALASATVEGPEWVRMAVQGEFSGASRQRPGAFRPKPARHPHRGRRYAPPCPGRSMALAGWQLEPGDMAMPGDCLRAE